MHARCQERLRKRRIHGSGSDAVHLSRALINAQTTKRARACAGKLANGTEPKSCWLVRVVGDLPPDNAWIWHQPRTECHMRYNRRLGRSKCCRVAKIIQWLNSSSSSSTNCKTIYGRTGVASDNQFAVNISCESEIYDASLIFPEQPSSNSSATCQQLTCDSSFRTFFILILTFISNIKRSTPCDLVGH